MADLEWPASTWQDPGEQLPLTTCGPVAALGATDLTPIQAMHAPAPAMGIAGGVDEVHMATVARRVLRSYRPHEGNWPTEYAARRSVVARMSIAVLCWADA